MLNCGDRCVSVSSDFIIGYVFVPRSLYDVWLEEKIKMKNKFLITGWILWSVMVVLHILVRLMGYESFTYDPLFLLMPFTLLIMGVIKDARK